MDQGKRLPEVARALMSMSAVIGNSSRRAQQLQRHAIAQQAGLVADQNGAGFAVYPDDLTFLLAAPVTKTHGIPDLPLLPGRLRARQFKGCARKFDTGQRCLFTQILSGSPAAPLLCNSSSVS